MPRFHHRMMPVIRPLWTVLAVSLLGLAAASCARAPQVVWVSPALAGPPDKIAERRTVEVMVRDDRSSFIIGNRGGADAESATLKTQDDITPELTRLIGEQLERQGYQVVPPGSGGDVALTVSLEELSYETGGSVLTEIKVSSSVGATTKKGGDTLTSRYTTNHEEDFATAPDEEENSELINMVVGKSLDAMLADEELKDFMSK